MDRFKEAMDGLQAFIRQKEQEEVQRTYEAIEANLAKIKANLDSWDSYHRQNISMDECEKSTEEWSMKEILESQHEDKEMEYVVQKVEEEEIVDKEEIVENLGEVEQEGSYIIEDNSTSSDNGDLVETSSTRCETDIEEECEQLPIHILINEKELEEVSKQEEIEESCQKMEVIKEESKEVELTMSRPLDIFLAMSPSKLQVEWVTISSFNFLGPYQYALLKTDGQLRAMCGLESRKVLASWVLVGNKNQGA
ncbi:coiled-coil domain-containing glutamate-rich protein 1-like [Arachis ipaensis]|uniref:coiled-coil domain-containing glutamate-rich protein 1-like n=1 Tax=Arachis ipaensis TaxID=130454 RepID=UPI0007AEFD96|nr:coiled-coil domain-containing glutamate-rich protein 1-like [Arachis ipaensis]